MTGGCPRGSPGGHRMWSVSRDTRAARLWRSSMSAPAAMALNHKIHFKSGQATKAAKNSQIAHIGTNIWISRPHHTAHPTARATEPGATKGYMQWL